jgi:hypothetical protein
METGESQIIFNIRDQSATAATIHDLPDIRM